MLNRMILVSLIILLVLPVSSQGQNPKVLLLVPEDNPEYLVIDFMQKIEAGVMIDILEDAGYQVDVVTASGKPITVGMNSFQPDHSISEIDANNYVGLILPSMKAPRRTKIPAEAAKIIRQFADQEKPIAAQVYGIAWLGEAGVLSGRKFSFVDANVNDIRLKNQLKGGIFTGNYTVVKDGNVITSGVCPETARRYKLPDGTGPLARVLIKAIENLQK